MKEVYAKGGIIPPSESKENFVEAGECIAPERIIKEVYVGNRKIPSYEEWEYSKNHVNVLGTVYTIETHKVSEDEYMQKNHLAGYCGEESKLIVIADMSEKEYFADMDEKEQETYRKKTLRHELIHAFLNESGLSDSASVPAGSWAKHEEMIDWIAIQFPKMQKAFEEVGCI